MGKLIKNFVKNHFLFLLLIPLVFYVQFVILREHLLYGFSDVDWGFLAFYKSYKELYPNIITNFINTFKAWGVYAHQSYYIGIQGDFFGLDYEKYQIVTHIFKALGTIALYPVFLTLSKRKSISFLGTFLFSISYAAVGTLYTTVTSSDYTAIITMALFLWIYILIVREKLKNFSWLIIDFAFLLFTLFLSTERMYPLLFFLAIFEGGLFIYNIKLKKDIRKQLLRIFVFFSLFIAIFIIKPTLFVDFVVSNGSYLLGRIEKGEWALILTPFITLGSILLPSNHWNFFGEVRAEKILEYLPYFVMGPFLFLSLCTIVISKYIFNNSVRFIKFSLSSLFIWGIIIQVLAIHTIEGFNKILIVPAFIGIYILIVGTGSFLEWFKNKKIEYLGLFLSTFFAFIFIFLTWISADTRLVFSAPHRYLTIPGLSISFFMATIICLISLSLWKKKNVVRYAAIIPLLILIPIISSSIYQIHNFFGDQLNNGFGAYDKTLMRDQLQNYIKDLPSDKSTLFSFSFQDDSKNGYYYDCTLLGGFQTWMLWHPSINFNPKLAPDLLWNQQDSLNTLVKEQNGVKGVYFREKFYDKKHFYAFKLKNKKVIDVTKQVDEEFGIE